MSKKQVRFSSKTAYINVKHNEVNSGKNAAENENLPSDEDSVGSMWEKLVLYYLSRLKGLCDWRSYSWTAHDNRCKVISKQSLASSLSGHLEDQIVSHVTEQAIKHTRSVCKNKLSDINTYMAAGYEEGKQQAAKIVIRSLKFGMLTGILKKDGSVYRIQEKYLDDWQPPKKRGKLFKKSYNTKQKRNHSKYTRGKKQNYRSMKNHTTLRSGKKFYKTVYGKSKKNKTKTKKNCFSRNQYRDGKICSGNKTSFNKYLRSTSSLLSRSSSAVKSTDSKRSPRAGAGPSARRKHSRVIIKKPVFPRPSGKRRDRSQTKSPTPSKSRSKTSVTKYKPRRLKECRRFYTPEPRRHGSVLSSMSSTISICSVCRRKRNRSISNDSETLRCAKKCKASTKHKK